MGAGGVRRKVYKKEKKGKGETVLVRSQESDYYGDEDYTILVTIYCRGE